MAVLLIIVLCVFIGALLLFRKRSSQIPGPNGKPLIGNLLDLNLKSLHIKLFEWSKQYGDIFQFSIFSRKFVVINSSDILREAFLKEPNATIFAARPDLFFAKYFYLNSDVAFSSLDPTWNKRRKLLHQKLNAYGEGLLNLEKQINRNLTTLMEELQLIEGQSIDPAPMVEDFIYNTIETLVLGRVHGKHAGFQGIMEKIDSDGNEVSNLGPDMIYNMFPLLRFLPFTHSKKLNELLKTKQEMISIVEQLSNDNPEDNGMYQSLKKVLQEKDETGHYWFTDDNLWGMVMNIFGGAYLTTRGTLMSMLHILAKRPDLQKSLQTEIDNIIGDVREPEIRDRQQCPLVEAFVLETLRYISHTPLALHFSRETTSLAGYQVEKNTSVLACLWSMHHSDSEWEDPFLFKPERFLEQDGSLKPASDPVRKRFLLFGTGRRSCPGEVFAKSRLFLFLSTLLHNFNVMEPQDNSLPEFDPRKMDPGLILQPKPFKIRFECRKHRFNYSN